MQSLLTRLRSLSESPANFIVIVRDEAKLLLQAIDAARCLLSEENARDLLSHCVTLQIFDDAIEKLEAGE